MTSPCPFSPVSPRPTPLSRLLPLATCLFPPHPPTAGCHANHSAFACATSHRIFRHLISWHLISWNRRKVGFFNMCLTAAVLSGLNPFVVVAVVLAWKLWASSKFLPRGCRFNPEVRTSQCGGECECLPLCVRDVLCIIRSTLRCVP